MSGLVYGKFKAKKNPRSKKYSHANKGPAKGGDIDNSQKQSNNMPPLDGVPSVLQTCRTDELVKMLNSTGQKLLDLKALLIQESIALETGFEKTSLLIPVTRFLKQVEMVDSIRISRCPSKELLGTLAAKNEPYHLYAQELQRVFGRESDLVRDLFEATQQYSATISKTNFQLDDTNNNLDVASIRPTSLPCDFNQDSSDSHSFAAVHTPSSTYDFNLGNVLSSTTLELEPPEPEGTTGEGNCDNREVVPCASERDEDAESGTLPWLIGVRGRKAKNFVLNKTFGDHDVIDAHKCNVVRKKLKGYSRPALQDVFLASSQPEDRSNNNISRATSRTSLGRTEASEKAVSNDAVQSTELPKRKMETWFDANERISRTSLQNSLSESRSSLHNSPQVRSPFYIRDYIAEAAAPLSKRVSFSPTTSRNAIGDSDSEPVESSDEDVSFDVQEFPCVVRRRRR